MFSPVAQWAGSTGTQKPDTQLWLLGHGTPVAQLHRPLVSTGSVVAQLLWLIDWQSCPVPHAMPQPPQFALLAVVLMHAPPQQRAATVEPHDVPSGCAP